MSRDAAIRATKLRRIRSGAEPRALELCSGCGGLSLGLAASGFSLQAHLENDPNAAKTYALNFDPPVGIVSAEWAAPRDMVQQGVEEVVAALGLTLPAVEAFDILVAGLPCQAFARIGRSKLRSIAGDDAAYQKDPRAKLYERFLEYVEAVQPAAIIIENVPDILNFGGHNVPEEICETLELLGYQTGYTLLNAAYYGVPQMRERLFLIGIDRSLGIRPGFPDPTHTADLPSGYEGARTFALRHLPAASRFLPIPQPAEGLPEAVSAREPSLEGVAQAVRAALRSGKVSQ